MRRLLSASATKSPRNVAGAFAAAICLVTVHQPANAKGCLTGAALGGAIGHMKHHTFLGIFGGCVGGIYVHHLYSKWKKEHPDGTMNDFVSENKDHLPEGWADRLSTVGETSDLRAGNAPHKQ
jgi:hypothetical protein